MPTIVDPTQPSAYFKRAHDQAHPKSLRRQTAKRYIGTSVRQAIEQVFTGLGGWEAMLDWAKQPANQTLFYSQILPKLLPTELAESGLAGNITVIVQRSPTEVKDSKARPLEINSSVSLTADEAGGLSAGPGCHLGNPSGTATHVVDGLAAQDEDCPGG
jgi:hypothetical protein